MSALIIVIAIFSGLVLWEISKKLAKSETDKAHPPAEKKYQNGIKAPPEEHRD